MGAMILAAGRGERMRPLSDATPKPLLCAGGKPLIVWQIEAFVRAGLTDIVVNASHRADDLAAALGDGRTFGARIAWSREAEPLEVAGGITTALPLLPAGPLIVASGDVWSAFDIATLIPRAQTMAHDSAAPRAHLVMVPNPPYHPQGDFALRGNAVIAGGAARLTFGNIAIYDTALFAGLQRGVEQKMLPLFNAWIAKGIVTGERYDGPWANVGTPADLAELDARLARAPSTT
ncbi:MAG TPA: nucleotidyltransferase family protein [Casimicrobiaceae bacterium]